MSKQTPKDRRDQRSFAFDDKPAKRRARRPAQFNGATYDARLDEKRLRTLFYRVLRFMADGKFRTLSEIQVVTGGTEASVSARLRDFRKEKFGGHNVNRRRRGDEESGLFEYQVLLKT